MLIDDRWVSRVTSQYIFFLLPFCRTRRNMPCVQMTRHWTQLQNERESIRMMWALCPLFVALWVFWWCCRVNNSQRWPILRNEFGRGFFGPWDPVFGENDLNISHVWSLSSWEGMMYVLFIVVSGGALIFARMLSCTFLRFTCFGGVGGEGWVGDVNVRWSCTHVACYATASRLPVHTCSMLRQWWGGVGWGCQRSLKLHTCCMLRNCVSVARAHVLDATPVMGWGWGGDVNVRWSCTHVAKRMVSEISMLNIITKASR